MHKLNAVIAVKFYFTTGNEADLINFNALPDKIASQRYPPREHLDDELIAEPFLHDGEVLPEFIQEVGEKLLDELRLHLWW